MVENKLAKKILLVALLLLALWLLVDDEATLPNHNDENNTIPYRRRHHLAVWTALRRHPPCSRIFRSLLEFDLMLWGLAVSLWLWKNTVGEKMTGYLLFQPADYDESKDRGVYFTESSLGKYHPLTQEQQEPSDYDDDEVDVNSNNKEGNHEERIGMEKGNENISLGMEHGAMQVDHGDNSFDDTDIPTFDDDFRNDSSTFEHFEPPSPISIAHAALDSLTLILVTLFMFTLSSAEGGRYVDGMEALHTFRFVALVAAPVFPLILFFVFSVGLVVPFRKRRSQWKILGYTIGAPLYHVTFRDGFIGDILTSSVRPLQDIAFTTFYLFSGMQGWWQQSYDLDAADLPLESNWLLHTMILPMCMMSPLWYRFCQNLRQTYEYKSRWPYLGNALKYFIAAEVGIFGVYTQSPGQSKAWLIGFVAATLYQIWWDVFMDWKLLSISEWKAVDLNLFERHITISIPISLRLRKTRIYSVLWLYWGIFGLNIILRFCWTLSFLPPHYLNRAGVLSETFDGDLSSYLNPIIASAEIIRRTMWGWLRVEYEAIKVARTEPRLRGTWTDWDEDDEAFDGEDRDANIEFKTMTLEDTSIENANLDETIPSPSFSKGSWIPKKMYEMTELQIVGELCVYATVFTGLGLLAAAHRDTF
mmetsp:Transcript_22551/g.62771  ORF Transcript_22551/g.62771 Transcript_22551/m.62771 type:complete len:645 (-) Transcript_22551:4071-6005(-)